MEIVKFPLGISKPQTKFKNRGISIPIAAPQLNSNRRARILLIILNYYHPAVLGIFPAPPNPANDQIAYTRQDLLGNTLPFKPGQTPGGVYILDIGIIRRRAAANAQRMNLTPV